jgi:ABC-2 type transport system ATP-binding protein
MLEARQLTKKFKDYTALDAVSFKVSKGEVFCLLGANGAGKTTTINLFLNFIQPTGGEALINNLNVTTEALQTKKQLAYIPESLMLYPNLTGLENLDYFASLSGSKHSKDILHNILLQAGLQTDAHSKRVSAYSKGMRQKVGIALALAKNAQVLLLDEPTSGLDPKASNEFSELLLKMRERDVAILMTTHDLFRAKETGTHIGIMKQGVLVEQFSTDQINHTDLEKLYLQHMN